MKRYEINLILNGLLKDNKKRKLHLSLSNRRFYNGIVISVEDEETLSFKDDVLGYITIPYDFIINIEPQVKEKQW